MKEQFRQSTTTIRSPLGVVNRVYWGPRQLRMRLQGGLAAARASLPSTEPTDA